MALRDLCFKVWRLEHGTKPEDASFCAGCVPSGSKCSTFERFLVPNTIPLMGFGRRTPKYWVLGLG